MASIQGIYIALFGRPADPEGLEFWTAQTKGGTDLSFLVGRLTAADEYQDLVDGKTPTQVINAIYQQLFDRDADPEGLAHYLELLASGEQSIETIAINILDGTSGSDLLTLDAKIDAADLFTASLDTPAEEDAYAGNTAEALGREFIDGVDANDRATQAEVDAAIEQLLTPGGEAPQEPTNPGNPGGGNPGGGNPGNGNGGVTPPPGTVAITNDTDLRTALANATGGETFVIDGNFTGRFQIDDSVTIIGINGATVTGGFDVEDDAVDVVISSLTIRTAGNADANAAIYTWDVDGGNDHGLETLQLLNVDVQGQGAGGARGLLMVETGAGPGAVDVTISDSSFTNLVSGVYAGIDKGNDFTISRTTFANNVSAVGGVGDGTSVEVTHSAFTGNGEDLGVEGFQTLERASFDRDTVVRSDGDAVEVFSYQPTQGEISITQAINYDNVVFVGEDQSLQAAIDNAKAGDIIYVGEGTYNESLIINKEVHLVAQNANTIINGVGQRGDGTISLYGDADGTTISGFTINAVNNGQAVYSSPGGLTDVTLSNNFFQAGQNTGGSLVYFNAGNSGIDIINNRFEGAALAGSPLLGIEADDVLIEGNHFGASQGRYVEVEIFGGRDNSTADVVVVGNTGLDSGDVHYG